MRNARARPLICERDIELLNGRGEVCIVESLRARENFSFYVARGKLECHLRLGEWPGGEAELAWASRNHQHL